jgi:hypothetical protein
MSTRLRQSHLRPVYTIDAKDRLIDANAAFVASMPYAGGIDALLGQSIWNFISGDLPRRLWEVMYERVRLSSAPLFVPVRSDTSTERRVIDLELHPGPHRTVRHVRECLWVETRSAIALLDTNYPRDERIVMRCAWCARIQVRLGVWQEIEDAQLSLGIETTRTLPTLQDTACSACQQAVLKALPARVA